MYFVHSDDIRPNEMNDWNSASYPKDDTFHLKS